MPGDLSLLLILKQVKGVDLDHIHQSINVILLLDLLNIDVVNFIMDNKICNTSSFLVRYVPDNGNSFTSGTVKK